jgi:hypothetical protein
MRHLLLAVVVQTLPNNHVDALACQIRALCEVCDASICQAITFELFGLVTLMHFQLQTQLMDMLTFLTYLMHEHLCWKSSDKTDRYFILLYLVSNCAGTGSVCRHLMLDSRGKLVPCPRLLLEPRQMLEPRLLEPRLKPRQLLGKTRRTAPPLHRPSEFRRGLLPDRCVDSSWST